MKFRKKPIVVDAIQYTGTDESKIMCGIVLRLGAHHLAEHDVWGIQTDEGFMEAKPGDWIITGVKGERYPCKPDIFEATYERLDE
jgi:hypothetical protein